MASPARLWLALGGLCCGVAFGFARDATVALVATAAVGAALLFLRRHRPLVATGLVCLAFSTGALDSHARIERGASWAALATRAPRCRFVVTALEAEGGLGTLAGLDRAVCPNHRLPREPGLVWLDDYLPPGSRLAGEGWLVPLEDDGFGWARRRFGAGAELVTIDSTETAPRGGLAGAAHRIRAGLDDATHGMPTDRAGLLKGVTTGDTSLLAESTVEEFRAAGLSHLVAVSGQNVAMVLAAVALATRQLPLRTRTALALAAVAMFVVVVGPQPSVLRAAAMAVIALAGLGFGSRAEPWHLLALALIAVIALRPAVFYSAGLHLSAAATAGLLLWARPLAARLHRLPGWMALGAAATLSAQFAVAPLVVALFGRVSLTAPIANVLALPAVPPATVLGLTAAVMGTASPRAGRVVAAAAEPFVGWILWVARTFGGAGWADLAVPPWCAWPLGAVVVAVAFHTAGARPRPDR